MVSLEVVEVTHTDSVRNSTMQESQGKSPEGFKSNSVWRVVRRVMRRGCRKAWKSGCGSGARERAKEKLRLSSGSVCMELSGPEMGSERGRAHTKAVP